MKNPIMLIIVASIVAAVLFLSSVYRDLKKVRQDYQAYQTEQLLPEYYKKEVPHQ